MGILCKLLFFPIKLIFRTLFWIIISPFKIFLSPVNITVKLIQLLLIAGLVAAILIFIFVGD